MKRTESEEDMTVTNDERREVAAKMRKHADGNETFIESIVADAIGTDFLKDAECWNRLADLIEPTPTNSDRGLTCDALLELADIMEGYARFCKERSIRIGSNLVECYASLIRDAVNACEARPDAPVAVDEVQTDTDAYMDDSEAAEGYHIVDVSNEFNENVAAINWVREQGGLDAVKARLMPEGMEWLVEAWPRFEDGKPVRLLDDFERYGDESGVGAVTMYPDGSFALNCRAYSKGERVNRPAPKVLDADGVPIEVGDTVWSDKGEQDVVKSANGPLVITEGMKVWSPDIITHTRPVLASDGLPLREGETVYGVCEGKPYEVKGFSVVYGDLFVTVDFDGKDARVPANQLTHERPDGWERLEEDAGKNPFDYCKGVRHRLDTCENAEAYKARDLVRRAKALAEREA